MTADRIHRLLQDEPESPPLHRIELFDTAIGQRLLQQRVIYLSSAIDQESARRVCQQLLVLEAEDSKRPITLFINSPGGEVYSGFAILDMMDFVSAEVITVAAGLSASMGTMILCCGSRRRRFALPNARVMIHQPLGGLQGVASDIAIEAKEILTIKERLIDILSQRSGKERDKIERDINRNYWMSAEEAQAYGLVDHVVASRAEMQRVLDGG
ncbi:MAG TPA: ATP-dependent Clp protease proteolytic subunit [Acidobacteriota bacterium]